MRAAWKWLVGFAVLLAGDARAVQTEYEVTCASNEQGQRICWPVVRGTTPDRAFAASFDGWVNGGIFPCDYSRPLVGTSGGGTGGADPADAAFVVDDATECTTAQSSFGNPIEPASGAKVERE